MARLVWRIRHLWHLGACIIIGHFTISAQSFVFKHTALSTVSNLGYAKSLVIHGVTQSDGFIWLATNTGILRFDGVEFHPFARNMADQIVPYVVEDVKMHISPGGDIWIVNAHRGLLHISRDGQSVNHLSMGAMHSANSYWSDMYFENDSLAYVTSSDWKVYRINLKNFSWDSFKAGSLQPVPGDDATFGLITASPNDHRTLWIGSKYGLLAFDKVTDQFQFYALDEPYHYFYWEWLTPLQVFHRKIILAGPYNVGVDVFDLDRRSWSAHLSIDPPDEPYHVSPLSLMTVSDSLVLAGLQSYDGLGVVSLNADGHLEYQARFYDVSFGSLHHMVGFAMAPNNIIFGVTSKGLTKITQPRAGFTFFRLTPEDGFRDNWQRSFLQLDDPHKFLMGTYKGDGLFEIDWQTRQKHVIPYKPLNGAFDFDVTMWDICRDDNGIFWIGTDSGLIATDLHKTRLWQPDFIQAHPVLSKCNIHFLRYTMPYLWISTTDNGLFEIDITTEKITQVDTNNITVNVVLPHGRQWWVGTETGLKEWDISANSWIPSDLQSPTTSITDLCQVGDSIWMATSEQGLWCISQNTQGKWVYRRFTNQENYLSNLLHKIVFVPEKHQLWLNTQYGYSCFNLDIHRFTNYTIDDGIVFSKKNQSIFARLYDGAIINGAHRYFQYFYPDSLEKHIAIPIPYIDEISSEGRPISFVPEKAIILKSGTENASFTVGGVNYNASPVNYYSYRFGGPRAQWSSWTTNKVVSYQNLKGGNYVFAFRVANKSYETSKVESMSVTIKKTLTETLGFKIAAILGLVALIYLPIWYLRRQERRESKIRAEYQQRINKLQMSALRLQMNPHFVFNSINSINYYIIQNDRDKASTYLAKFSRLIRLILENSKSEFTTLELELEAITLYLEIERMRFEGKFEYEIEVEKQVQLSTIKIPPLIIQPYIENAIWHGFMPREGVGHLFVSIRDKGGYVQCIIEDDGIGREAAAQFSAGKTTQKESLGTKITKDRLDFIQSKYGIETDVETVDLKNMDGSPAGTRVTVVIPKLTSVAL